VEHSENAREIAVLRN